MTSRPVDALADALYLSFRSLRALGLERAKAMTEGELRGNAQALSMGVLSTLWQARHASQSWERLSQSWERAARDAPYGELLPGDHVELIKDNGAAFALRERLHGEAKRSIDVATYYLQGDATGRAVAEQLLAAVRRGVRVRLVADGEIVHKKQREGLGSQDLLDELRRGGVEVRAWHDPSRPWDANHRKLLLVDGEALLLGGRNVADHYAGDQWRDIEVLLRGPSASSAASLFERTFHGAPEPPPEPSARVYATTPADVATHATFSLLLRCLREARRTVDIENAYFLPHPAVLRGIADATRRGVRVRVMTNSAESNDLDFANYRLYTGFLPLLGAGAELYLRRGRGRTLHCKYFVADGALLSLGSTNLDYYSPRFCTEANLQVRSEALGAMLTAWFDEGLAEADRADDPAALARVRDAQRFSRVFDLALHDTQ